MAAEKRVLESTNEGGRSHNKRRRKGKGGRNSDVPPVPIPTRPSHGFHNAGTLERSNEPSTSESKETPLNQHSHLNHEKPEKLRRKRISRSKSSKKQTANSENHRDHGKDHTEEARKIIQQGEDGSGQQSRKGLARIAGKEEKTKKKKRAKKRQSGSEKLLPQIAHKHLPTEPGKALPAGSVENDGQANPKGKRGTTLEKSAVSEKAPSFNRWMESTAAGGHFLRKDPIITRDGQHLLLADLSSVYVYSVQTSLLTRQLKLDGNETVSDFTISSTQPKHLFLASKSGSISKWDWTDGHKISTWSTRKDLAEINQNSWDETLQEDELICVFHHGKSQQSEILSVKLSTQKERPSSESRLLRRPAKLMLRNSPAGTLPLVLYSTTTVLFGLPGRSSDQELYIWREIAVTEEISSVDISQISDTTKNSRKGNESVDLVIGCKSGLILVYEDVLKALLTLEGKTTPDLQGAITPRRLHWHRNAVESVKYSRDGNYLISGGRETVLVIWQLSTDRRQYLPHLASPILNLSVSPSGNSYALLLAENSAMVLSTSTLEPTASISGLGLPCPVSENSLSPPILMALDPSNPTDLLCATSPSPSSPSSSLTFLQTYSLSPTSTHISRQALARNSTTNLQTAPNGQTVKDPSLTHLQPTNDGTWLVTVEEWSPDARSLDALFPKDQQFSGARRRSREIALRVWKRGNGATSGWETNTRINDPHSGSVLALAVNPARSEFATVGEDGKIRFWTPKVRRRDGQNITDGDGNVLHTWSCRLAIELEGSDVLSTSSDDLSGAALAFSDDGSALAVYFANNATAFVSNDQPTRPSQAASQPISIFSSRTGALVYSIPHLLVSPSTHHPKLAFLGRNLVALSSHLRVWDLVSSSLIFGLALPSIPISPQHPESSSSHSNLTHLASYPTSSTFAIAFPVPPKKGRHNPTSRIAIFNPEESSPIFTTTVNERVTALVSIPGGAGYVYADSQGRVTTIKAPGYGALTSRGAARQLDRRPGGLKNGLENMFGSWSRPATGGGEGVETSGRRLAIEDGAPESDRSGAVTRALSGGGSWDTMPVRDLFEKVASAFARKPVAAAV